MKKELVNVRIDAYLMEHLNADRERSGQSISDVIRSAIKNYYEPEDEELKFENNHFAFTDDFKEVYKWIIEKRVYPHEISTPLRMTKLAEMVRSIVSNTFEFPLHIRNEFKKVLLEIESQSANPIGKYFTFGLATSSNPFNYSMLIDFLLDKNLKNINYIEFH